MGSDTRNEFLESKPKLHWARCAGFPRRPIRTTRNAQRCLVVSPVPNDDVSWNAVSSSALARSQQKLLRSIISVGAIGRPTQYRSFRRRSSQTITWLMLTNKTVQENADKQTQYKSEKVSNLKYSKTKLPWFSCLLQHSARKRGGLILQRSRAQRGGLMQERPQDFG